MCRRPGLTTSCLHRAAIPRNASAPPERTTTSAPWKTPLLDDHWSFMFYGNFKDEGVVYSWEVLVQTANEVGALWVVKNKFEKKLDDLTFEDLLPKGVCG